jgi:hypothetical protein
VRRANEQLEFELEDQREADRRFNRHATYYVIGVLTWFFILYLCISNRPALQRAIAWLKNLF